MEINSRVNYPLKTCLVQLESCHDIDMDCLHVRYCVSWFTIRVASEGIQLAVQSWNDHPIPGMYLCYIIRVIGLPLVLFHIGRN